MLFTFSPLIQAGLAAGKYAQVVNSAGVPIGMVRDAATGKFAAHAVGMVNNGMAMNPLFAPLQAALSGAQMYQTHRGFQATLGGIQAIQSSLGVLQATTAVIGVGTAVGVGLSAVNLWQTLKLRKDVKELKLDVRDGFIDLKAALKDQGREVIKHIDLVADDIKFEQHRLELIKAYGRFLEATKLIKTSIKFKDTASRNIELANARQTLAEALANYNNPDLLSETCAAGQLRRLECAWAIEQAIILTYQLQNELNAVSDRVIEIQNTIRQDCLKVIDCCQSQEEIDFIFPEITCIHNNDLVVLEAWQNQVDWTKSLPPSELELLAITETQEAEIIDSNVEVSVIEKPAEIINYENAKDKSHTSSLLDQMRLMMSSKLRQEYEVYVSNRAYDSGHKTLNSSNLEQASNLSIANLYWYFKTREKFDSLVTN